MPDVCSRFIYSSSHVSLCTFNNASFLRLLSAFYRSWSDASFSLCGVPLVVLGSLSNVISRFYSQRHFISKKVSLMLDLTIVKTICLKRTRHLKLANNLRREEGRRAMRREMMWERMGVSYIISNVQEFFFKG